MRKRALWLGLIVVLAAGCRVNQTEDEDGERGVRIEPAPVQVELDTASVLVPDVNIGADTAAHDTAQH